MIIQCTKCATKLKVPDSSAGQKARCPSCSAIIDVDPVIDVVADVVAESPPRFEPRPLPPSRPKSPSSDEIADVSPDAAPSRPSPGRSTPGSSRRSAPRSSSSSSGVSAGANSRKTAPARQTPPKKAAAAGSGPPKSGTPAKKKKAAAAKKKKRKKKREPAYEDTFGFDDVASYGEAVDEYGYDDVEDYDDIEDYDDADDFGNPYASPTRSRSSRSTSSGGGTGLRVTGIGLLMIAWGVVGLFVGCLGALIFAAAIDEHIGAVMLLGVLGVGAISILVGHLLCLAAPGMAKVLAILSMICMGVQWIVRLRIRTGQVVSQEERVVGAVLGIASLFLIQIFLKTMAGEARRDDLGGRAMGILLGYIIAVVLGAIAIGMLFSGPPAANLGLIVAMIAGLMGLAIAIVQIILLFQLGSSLVAVGGTRSSGRSRQSARSPRPARSRSSRGHYVTFSYTISIVVMTFKMNSAPVHIAKGQGTFSKGLPYTLITLVLGWWGIPWGPIYSVMSIVENSRGGNEVG